MGQIVSPPHRKKKKKRPLCVEVLSPGACERDPTLK